MRSLFPTVSVVVLVTFAALHAGASQRRATCWPVSLQFQELAKRPTGKSQGETPVSMHISVVAIKGNHLEEIGDVLKKCKYTIEKSFKVRSGKDASRELAWKGDRNRVAKAAYFASGWTFLLDPELVLTTDDVWLDYSRKWNTRVVGWLCETTSGTFGLAVFESGKKRRQVVSVDGEVKVDEGMALAEESGMKWSEASVKGVLKIAKDLGAAYDFPADRDYTVFQLRGSGE
jgi:hypothetical protein